MVNHEGYEERELKFPNLRVSASLREPKNFRLLSALELLGAAIGGGRKAHLPGEHSGEIVTVGKATLFRDKVDVFIGKNQSLRGFFQTSLEEVIIGSDAIGFFKESNKIVFAEVTGFCQVLIVKFQVKSVFNGFHGWGKSRFCGESPGEFIELGCIKAGENFEKGQMNERFTAKNGCGVQCFSGSERLRPVMGELVEGYVGLQGDGLMEKGLNEGAGPSDNFKVSVGMLNGGIVFAGKTNPGRNQVNLFPGQWITSGIENERRAAFVVLIDSPETGVHILGIPVFVYVDFLVTKDAQMQGQWHFVHDEVFEKIGHRTEYYTN